MSVFPLPSRDEGPSAGQQGAPLTPASSDPFERSCERLFASLREASTLMLVRFPDAAAPALRPAELVRINLERVLLDPCDIDTFALNRDTVCAVLTPRTGRALDPLNIYSVIDLFNKGTCLSLGLTEDAPLALRPQVYPLSYISPVGGLQDNIAALNELLEIIVNKRLGVQFQPIVDLTCGRVHGYEALVRLPQAGNLKRVGSMFHAADRARLVSWLDLACQEQCFAAAKSGGVRDYLFLNMDAEGLAHLHLAEHSLADRASENGIAPSRVVMEITERQTVEDFPRLVHYIEELRSRGFKIAIDDAGEGYSSLHAIAELRPDFVKIDRSLVRNLESNGTRRALLQTLAQYATQIGASVIAEGIETRDELATVIELGVTYGQGYLLGKPADRFKGFRQEMRAFVADRMAHRRTRLAGRSYPVSRMARTGCVMEPTVTVEFLDTKFGKNPDLESVVVVSDERTEGLVMRDWFYYQLAANPAVRSKTVGDVMDRQPLMVDAETRLEEVAERAYFRKGMAFHHDIIVTRRDRYVGVVPIRQLLEAVLKLKTNRAKYTHPVSGLPTTVMIEGECQERLATERPTVVLRTEIKQFRVYNEAFGPENGDGLMEATVRILQDALARCGEPDDFLGHEGGARFVVLINPDGAEGFCREAARQFDDLAAQLTARDPRRRAAFAARVGGGEGSTPLCLQMIGVSNRRRPMYSFVQARELIENTERPPRCTDGSAFVVE